MIDGWVFEQATAHVTEVTASLLQSVFSKANFLAGATQGKDLLKAEGAWLSHM